LKTLSFTVDQKLARELSRKLKNTTGEKLTDSNILSLTGAGISQRSSAVVSKQRAECRAKNLGFGARLATIPKSGGLQKTFDQIFEIDPELALNLAARDRKTKSTAAANFAVEIAESDSWSRAKTAELRSENKTLAAELETARAEITRLKSLR